MLNKYARRPVTRATAGRAMAELMPMLIRGIQLDFFVRRGVTQTQFLVLGAVLAFEHGTMGALARSLHVTMPTMSGIVERLVQAGFLRRAPHPDDRRQVVVSLTPKGRGFLEEFQGVIQRRWEEVLRPLSSTELAAFHHVITKLRRQLNGIGS